MPRHAVLSEAWHIEFQNQIDIQLPPTFQLKYKQGGGFLTSAETRPRLFLVVKLHHDQAKLSLLLKSCVG